MKLTTTITVLALVTAAAAVPGCDEKAAGFNGGNYCEEDNPSSNVVLADCDGSARQCTHQECHDACAAVRRTDGPDACRFYYFPKNGLPGRCKRQIGACTNNNHPSQWPQVWEFKSCTVTEGSLELAYTVGNCRGGGDRWDNTKSECTESDLVTATWNCNASPQLWKCYGQTIYTGPYTLTQCNALCNADPQCASFDMETENSDGQSTCCLFKAGNTGNGDKKSGRSCYVPKAAAVAAPAGNAAGTSTNPAASCKDLIGQPSGEYWFQIAAANGGSPFKAYCDMDSDDGGWMLLGTQVKNKDLSKWANHWRPTELWDHSITTVPQPNSNTGSTARFPFATWNAIAAESPGGAFKMTTNAWDSDQTYTGYTSYWKATCRIQDWDTAVGGNSGDVGKACTQDFMEPTFETARRNPRHSGAHGVIQGYGNQLHGDMLTLTSFQSSPAVGKVKRTSCQHPHRCGGTQGGYGGYQHGVGFSMWFRPGATDVSTMAAAEDGACPITRPKHANGTSMTTGIMLGVDCQSSFKSCRDVPSSGVYNIKADGGQETTVYCDMNTEGGGWALAFSLTKKTAADNLANAFAIKATSTTTPSTDETQDSLSGSAVDELIPNPQAGYDVLLKCTKNGQERYLKYENVDASRLISPSNTDKSCVEQGGGIDCKYSYTNFGNPVKASAGLLQDESSNYNHVINRDNPNSGYRYRWGVGYSTWNVQWGIDATDNEYDCGNDGIMDDTDSWSVWVRPFAAAGPQLPTSYVEEEVSNVDYFLHRFSFDAANGVYATKAEAEAACTADARCVSFWERTSGEFFLMQSCNSNSVSHCQDQGPGKPNSSVKQTWRKYTGETRYLMGD